MSTSKKAKVGLACPRTKSNYYVEIGVYDAFTGKIILHNSKQIPYGKHWIQRDYLCVNCWWKHDYYIHVEDRNPLEVITEKEFQKRGLKNYLKA